LAVLGFHALSWTVAAVQPQAGPLKLEVVSVSDITAEIMGEKKAMLATSAFLYTLTRNPKDTTLAMERLQVAMGMDGKELMKTEMSRTKTVQTVGGITKELAGDNLPPDMRQRLE